MAYADKERIIISIGGSLVVTEKGIDTDFLSQLNTFVREQLAKNNKRQFFLVVGGGTTARNYRDAGQKVVGHELTEDDQDWLGVHSTRLNAHLIRTIFRDIAHQSIVKDYTIILKPEEPVVVAAGWKPGWSTDYCAILLAADYHVPTVINMSNISQVYDKDPKAFPDAKSIDHLTWEEFRKFVGDDWSPGMHAPFDPIAAKKAQELHTKVVVMGKDFANLQKYMHGESFTGTVIE